MLSGGIFLGLNLIIMVLKDTLVKRAESMCIVFFKGLSVEIKFHFTSGYYRKLCTLTYFSLYFSERLVNEI